MGRRDHTADYAPPITTIAELDLEDSILSEGGMPWQGGEAQNKNVCPQKFYKCLLSNFTHPYAGLAVLSDGHHNRPIITSLVQHK